MEHEVHYRVYKNPTLDTILSQINQIHFLAFYFSNRLHHKNYADLADWDGFSGTFLNSKVNLVTFGSVTSFPSVFISLQLRVEYPSICVAGVLVNGNNCQFQ
jgi:hypothetical protein